MQRLNPEWMNSLEAPVMAQSSVSCSGVCNLVKGCVCVCVCKQVKVCVTIPLQLGTTCWIPGIRSGCLSIGI